MANTSIAGIVYHGNSRRGIIPPINEGEAPLGKPRLANAIPLAALCPLILSSCVQFPDTQGLLSVGTPFVVKGTATVLNESGPCRAWIGENGVTYHLFQDPLLENQGLDQISQPGTTSRLVLVTRSDLQLACQVGTLAEVQEVLEIE